MKIPERSGPHQEVALSLLGDDANIRNQDPALVTLVVSRSPHSHTVEPGPRRIDDGAEVEGGFQGLIRGHGKRQFLAEKEIPKTVRKIASPVTGLSVLVSEMLDQGENVVQVNAIHYHFGGPGVDGFNDNVARSAGRKKKTLMLESERRGRGRGFSPCA